MLKIRLARKGRIHRPYYAIVVANSTAPRDGRFKEKIGTYDPLAKLRSVRVDADRVISWMLKGAQLTKTARDLCSAGGILLVKHLIDGMLKKAIDKKIAHKRLNAWQKIVEKRKKPRLHFESTTSLSAVIDNAEQYETMIVSPKNSIKGKEAQTAKV